MLAVQLGRPRPCRNVEKVEGLKSDSNMKDQKEAQTGTEEKLLQPVAADAPDC